MYPVEVGALDPPNKKPPASHAGGFFHVSSRRISLNLAGILCGPPSSCTTTGNIGSSDTSITVPRYVGMFGRCTITCRPTRS